MSDCTNGGRLVYQPPEVREYDQQVPIRGKLLYADGTKSAFTFSRLVNGRERRVVAVEVDGARYAPIVRVESFEWMGD